MTFWDFAMMAGPVGMAIAILFACLGLGHVIRSFRKPPVRILDACDDELCIAVHESHDELREEDRERLVFQVRAMRADASRPGIEEG